MVHYRCFDCRTDVDESYLKKKIRCPYCGSKLIFKPRSQPTKVLAR